MSETPCPTAHSYLMEGPDEANRLLIKDNTNATLSQLLETGFAKLPNDPCVVDAGTGVGVVARQMASLLHSAHENAELILLDGSRERLNTAADNLSEYNEITTRYVECNLDSIPLSDHSVDYVFCRFVFEYLTNPEAVFDELHRLVKPGGKLVIGDLDHNCLNHYPIPSDIETKLEQLVKAVNKTGLFDFFAGRKLYSYFYKYNYSNISVHFHPHHLFYGDLKASDATNWEIKLDRLIKLQFEKILDLEFDLAVFKKDFLRFLHRPDRFSYTPLILVEGIKS